MTGQWATVTVVMCNSKSEKNNRHLVHTFNIGKRQFVPLTIVNVMGAKGRSASHTTKKKISTNPYS